MSDLEFIAYAAVIAVVGAVALCVATLVLFFVLVPIGALYSWIKFPEYRPAAVAARNAAAQAWIAGQEASGRRRAFLRRRAERAAKQAREAARANPWKPA
jgi:hypothetical protein